MGPTIGDVLPFAVGVALSPIPIVAVILMLATPKGRSNGIAFVVGWFAGVALVCAGAALILDGVSDEAGPTTFGSILKIALGAASILLGLRQWRTRPAAGVEPHLPDWMQALDRFTAGKALGTGGLLGAVNPKNLLLTLAAGSAIGDAALPGGQLAVVVLVYTVLATLSVALPVVVYVAGGDRSAKTLAGWREWLVANNPAIMAVLFVVLGAVILGKGIGGL